MYPSWTISKEWALLQSGSRQLRNNSKEIQAMERLTMAIGSRKCEFHDHSAMSQSNSSRYDLNTNYGTAADLLALSNALHDRGMYLMVDVVANHMV